MFGWLIQTYAQYTVHKSQILVQFWTERCWAERKREVDGQQKKQDCDDPASYIYCSIWLREDNLHFVSITWWNLKNWSIKDYPNKSLPWVTHRDRFFRSFLGMIGSLSYCVLLGHWILFRLVSQYFKMAGSKYDSSNKKAGPVKTSRSLNVLNKEVGREKRTPAMRLGLEKGKITI